MAVDSEKHQCTEEKVKLADDGRLNTVLGVDNRSKSEAHARADDLPGNEQHRKSDLQRQADRGADQHLVCHNQNAGRAQRIDARYLAHERQHRPGQGKGKHQTHPHGQSPSTEQRGN